MSNNPNPLPTPIVINRRELICNRESEIEVEEAERELKEFERENAIATERMLTGEDVLDHNKIAEALRVHRERTGG